jgi:hypothetical protein
VDERNAVQELLELKQEFLGGLEDPGNRSDVLTTDVRQIQVLDPAGAASCQQAAAAAREGELS